MKTPHPTWLLAFEAAARYGSFTAAAAELNLTAAAVSQHIRLLEKHVGARLFERLPRGVALTDIGQAYAQPVRQSFAELQRATDGLFARPSRRVVRVRASITWAALILAPRLADFRQAHPEIDIQLSTFVWSDRFEAGNSDVDIRWGHGDWPEGAVQLLAHESAIVVCHPADTAWLAGRRDIRDFPFACLHHVIGFETEWQRLSDHFGLALPAPPQRARYDSSLLALWAMTTGGGAMIVLESFARPFLDSGQLVAPLPHRVPISGAHYMVQADGAGRNDAVQTFCRWAAALYPA
ncbi:LysR family transcriptional regulator [Mesorhizobium sp. ES1-3]|uniref:LysR family transcriptional regulator n=1 Tax=Mesorhizobium sp. ES1-3 TaxID=2876628 RepID=UPI001CCAAE1E|nr:LysR family transcriptional regulator [Mesorhizobium sp. ES1-3]MBZ9669968.1 LysR family transcriptional regulator [Mesorhizobium sp. ES1-3]